MGATGLVHEHAHSTVESLKDRTWLLLVALLPIPLTSGFFIVHSIATNTPSEAYGMPIAYFAYALANAITVAVLYGLLTDDERDAVFSFSRPSTTEVGWAVGLFVVGLGVYQLTMVLNSALGYQMQGMSYSLASTPDLLLIICGAVILAPVTEEVLYRGLILGVFLSRGFRAASAVLIMTVLFALIHLPNFGVAGTIFISVWGLLPAILRLRFDNLSGAVLMHMLNNGFAYVIVVGFLSA